MFSDRNDAGRRLAQKLLPWKDKNPLVLAIPRGGVVVAEPIAAALEAPLDVIIPKKIGAPQNPELAIGAVTQDGTTLLNQHAVHLLQLNHEEIQELVDEEVAEINRRLSLYKEGFKGAAWEGHTLILVDDGIATGFTVLAALKSLHRYQAREIVLAVPVAPPETLELLKTEVDSLVVLEVPQDFAAVGQFYREFDSVSDQRVISILRQGRPLS